MTCHAGEGGMASLDNLTHRRMIDEWEAAKKLYAMGDYRKAGGAFREFADRWWLKMTETERKRFLRYRKDCDLKLSARNILIG
jgi:hypothetical protein